VSRVRENRTHGSTGGSWKRSELTMDIGVAPPPGKPAERRPRTYSQPPSPRQLPTQPTSRSVASGSVGCSSNEVVATAATGPNRLGEKRTQIGLEGRRDHVAVECCSRMRYESRVDYLRRAPHEHPAAAAGPDTAHTSGRTTCDG
jgi:hypothetical protein